ncbi:MAG TPA: phosphohistidine phosphatase SixA [Kofleriaceae bacterium]|jgi:phosphohistidine phosphatase
MHVFLIRHAEAVDETLELRDPSRHLTTHGRAQARSLGDRLRWHDCEPTHVWTSPLVRAVQTAELVAAGLGATVAIEVLPALAPGESERAVVAALQALPHEASVVLVGHEPGMSGLAALLVAAPDFGALDKAEAVRIIDGKLRWRFAWNAEAPAPA